MKYHPDKNLDGVDEAKAKFLLVQQAYDVLSDSQERAWYDGHRDQILRGSQTDYEDTSLDVFPYFTAACYKGFGDDREGFYAVYGEVFEKLAAEDIEFMDSPEEHEAIPKFGTATSDYETVVGPFYAHWQSYCTVKSYAWLCPHNVNEIRDRRIMREIEKEMKKIAQKARKERNDEVRALVAFVRKRDKRVQEYRKVLEERAEQNRVKQQQHRLAQLKKNLREASDAQKNHQTVFNTSDHEQQLRQMEQAYGSDSEFDDEEEEDDEENGEDDADEEAEYVDDLYCIACNKAFKNISSFENHESSKKHKDNVLKLGQQMQEEEKSFRNDDDKDSLDESRLSEDITDEESAPEAPQVRLSKKAKKSKNKVQRVLPQCEQEASDVEELEEPLNNVSIGNVSDHSDDWTGGNKKSRKAKQKKGKPSKAQTAKEEESKSIEPEKHNENGVNKKSKKGKKNEEEEKPADGNIDTSHSCVTCHSTFDSKNKLFNHLKKTNHGVYIPKTTAAPVPGKRSKK